MKGPFLVRLAVTTFRGISIGAQHWYGTLHVSCKRDSKGTTRFGYKAWSHPHDEVELKYVLTEEQAAILREKDSDPHWPQAGEETARFDTRDQVYAAARQAFKELYTPDDLLVSEGVNKNRDYYIAMEGLKTGEFNMVPDRDQWTWLDTNGFLQDEAWTHA